MEGSGAEAKADKDASNGRLETPLFLVATHGYATAVRVLTEAGADKDKADESGLTPLCLASMHGRSVLLQGHMFCGLAVCLYIRTYLVAALVISVAAKSLHIDTTSVCMCVGCGLAGPQAVSDCSALRHVAAENGHLESVQVLIEAKASINTAAKTGATPLFLAAKRGHLQARLMWQNFVLCWGSPNSLAPLRRQVVSLLVGSGAEKDEAAEGVTPLFAAAYFGRFEVARFLAQAGLPGILVPLDVMGQGLNHQWVAIAEFYLM